MPNTDRDKQSVFAQLFGDDLALEVHRARTKFPDQEVTMGDGYWLSVLTEEVGECARAINDGQQPSELRAELVQVAAMAYRWWVSTQYRENRENEEYDRRAEPFHHRPSDVSVSSDPA